MTPDGWRGVLAFDGGGVLLPLLLVTAVGGTGTSLSAGLGCVAIKAKLQFGFS